MNKANISVVGSYAAGLTMKTKRFPSCGETLLGSDFTYMHGGKGSNQAIACARAGAAVSFIACIGNDMYGHNAIELYQKEGISTDNLLISSVSATGVGFILVNENGDNEIVIDLAANNELSTKHIKNCEQAIAASDVLLMQLEIPLDPVSEALNLARKHEVTTILNPAPYQPLTPEILSRCSLVTPNETEAKLILGLDAEADIEIRQLGHGLLQKGVGASVITLGEKGCLITTPDKCEHIPAFSVPVVDTTGAGDTFTASLGVALAEKATLAEAVRFASAASALSVTKYGVIDSLPLRSETNHFLQTHI